MKPGPYAGLGCYTTMELFTGLQGLLLLYTRVQSVDHHFLPLLISCGVALLLALCTIDLVQSTGEENGFISFATSSLTSVEDSNGQYTSVSIPFTRDGGTSGTVAATFKVRSPQ